MPAGFLPSAGAPRAGNPEDAVIAEHSAYFVDIPGFRGFLDDLDGFCEFHAVLTASIPGNPHYIMDNKTLAERQRADGGVVIMEGSDY